ncbi:poly polymerase catalytic domain-containing protein [Aspergillus varians]
MWRYHWHKRTMSTAYANSASNPQSPWTPNIRTPALNMSGITTASHNSFRAMNTAESPFIGLVISVSGHCGRYKHEDLKTIIESMGAVFSERATSGCTHLVTTAREVQNNSSRVIKAYNAYTCEIVSVNWLLDSEMAGWPLPEREYRVTVTKAERTTASTAGDQVRGMKRLLEADAEGIKGPAPQKLRLDLVSDTQKLIIPAHRACPLKHEYSIAVDQFGHPWDAMLVKSTAKGKNNNYYHLQLLVDGPETKYVSWACWGRIGDAPHQLKCSPCDSDTAKEDFEARFNEKAGFSWWTRFWHPPREGKFRYMPPSYVSRKPGDDPFNIANANYVSYNIPPPKCSLPGAVQKVVALIFKKEQLVASMESLPYDARKLPLGQLNRDTLAEGYNVLKELSELIKSPALSWTKYRTPSSEVSGRLSSEYFSIIPHVFGRNQPPVISTMRDIEKETELLDDLVNALVANDIVSSAESNYVHPLEQELHQLHLDEITPLGHKSFEFDYLSRYFLHTARNQPIHSLRYKIVDIFRIRRRGEAEQFASSAYARLAAKNRRLLWHGSKTSNFAGILNQGLRIKPPGVGQTGSSLGRGVYFSDSSSRSLGFTSASKSAEGGLLLLCDVELGYPVNLVSGTGGVRGKRKGTISTISAPFNPINELIDGGTIHPSLVGVKVPDVSGDPRLFCRQSEYVVYDAAQIQVRYLVSVIGQ